MQPPCCGRLGNLTTLFHSSRHRAYKDGTMTPSAAPLRLTERKATERVWSSRRGGLPLSPYPFCRTPGWSLKPD